MKVALVYDRVNKWGGAERVLLALHKIFPDAPLYTSVYNPKSASWAKVFDIKTSFLHNFPFAPYSHEVYAPFMPLAFESFSFDEYDLVISVTSEAAKGIITKPPALHICYCLTPTRYLWSGYQEYFRNTLLRFVSKPIISYLRKWDLQAAQRPDIYIAISKEVQKRIKKYYGRESLLVYPPVTLENSKYEILNSKQNTKYNPPAGGLNTKYFLVVSRLVEYKRIDIVIEACNNLKLPLKIIGKGVMGKKLKSIAGTTVEFIDNLTDKELVRYYRDCRALIFPGKEDFGLVIAEAQRLGKPVIAYKEGGALEIIKNNKTGLFFYPQTKEALKETLQKFDSFTFDNYEFKKRMFLFREKRFAEEFLKMVELGYRKYKKI